MASWDRPHTGEHGVGEEHLEGQRGRTWPASWLRPGRVAWATFLVIWGGLVLVGAPADLAMLPAAGCAVVNLVLLRMDERLLGPEVPDTVPASWSGIADDASDDASDGND